MIWLNSKWDRNSGANEAWVQWVQDPLFGRKKGKPNKTVGNDTSFDEKLLKMENLQHTLQKMLKRGSANDQCGPDPVGTLHFLQRWTQIFFREWTPQFSKGAHRVPLARTAYYKQSAPISNRLYKWHESTWTASNLLRRLVTEVWPGPIWAKNNFAGEKIGLLRLYQELEILLI